MSDEDAATARTIPGRIFVGVVVASIGGPLALVALSLPGAAGDALSSAGLTVALALVVFLAPLVVWLGFSERIASVGGLTAFVEAAAGRRIARAQALVWIASYFLYLPYTVTYVVYDILAPVFPGVTPYRGALELVVPVGIVVLALAPARLGFVALAVSALVQLGLTAVLGGLLYANGPAGGSSFGRIGAAPLGRGVGGVALLFVCASLPLFFGAEVRGERRTIRRGLGAGYALTAVVLLVAAIPFASIAGGLANSDLPGVSVALAYSGRPLAVAVALTSAASVVGLILLELLALGRLVHWLAGTRIRPTLAAIGVPFVVADAISLVNPDRFYADLLRPSLIALFLSQLIVFAVYPLYRRRTRPGRLPAALAVAAVSVALVGYGLYSAITTSVGS